MVGYLIRMASAVRLFSAPQMRASIPASYLLRQIQDYYGTYRAFEIVSTKDLSPKTRVIYLVLDFEKGPLFAKFVVYRSGQAWILAYFNFNTKEELVFPSCP